MPRRVSHFAGLGIATIGLFLLAAAVWHPSTAADPQPKLLTTAVVSAAAARTNKAGWGEMRRYFTGESLGTKNVLTAVAVVQPGKAVHAAHRHAEEEYLILMEGSGTWSVEGRQQPAKAGDILYTAPWAYHGLTNTGDRPLTFAVVRFNAKGVAIPPQPDSHPNEL